MNKSIKLILLSGLIVAAGCVAFYISADSSKAVEKTEEVVKLKKTETTKSESNRDGSKTETKSEKNADPVPSDKLNMQATVAPKAKGKIAVVFRDGTTVSDETIKKEIDSLPEQLSSKMSLSDVKAFLAWKAAYQKVMTEAAIKSGVMKSAAVRDLIDKRKKTTAGFMLLNEKSNELMTFDALKKHYDSLWDKHLKGTKQFSLTAITTSDKATAVSIKKSVKDEESLKKILDANQSTTKHMEMDSRPQSMFPPEISDAVLKQGANTVVGPFEIKGSSMLFYVKSIRDAQKREFTEETAEEYKKVAARDFIKEYTQSLYKKYNVKVFDVNGKVVDPFEVTDNKSKAEPNQENLVKLSKLKDDTVLATYTGGKITVKDLKTFFKVESIVDQTFVSMSQQFGIPLEKVAIYAVKLVMDDCVLSKEVQATHYDEKQEVIDKLVEVGNMEIQHAYFQENIKVKTEDIRRTFDKFIKSIPEADKNDNEMSVRMAFFPTQEDAAQALKKVNSGEEKFSSIYKDKLTKKEAVDLGYVKKRGVPAELWALLKTGASGTCCQRIVELDSKQFGIDGKNFVLIYIADRRPVTLPSLSNEADKKYFQRLAEREKAIELAKSHLIAGVKTIDGKSIDDISKSNPEYVDRMISVLLGYAG